MLRDEDIRKFNDLRERVRASEILRLHKKHLSNLLGKKRSGPAVDATICSELRRRGIVHLPKVMPAHQGGLVLLAMQGSRGEKELEEFATAIRTVPRYSAHDVFEVDRPLPAIPLNNAATDERIRTCAECKRRYSVDETAANQPGFWDGPYYYGNGSTRYCLACWLGVGPNDVTNADPEYEKQFGRSDSPSATSFSLKTEREQLALSRSDLASSLGVCERTVVNWETNGLPKHGTAARMVRTTIEKLRAERAKARGATD